MDNNPKVMASDAGSVGAKAYAYAKRKFPKTMAFLAECERATPIGDAPIPPSASHSQGGE